MGEIRKASRNLPTKGSPRDVVWVVTIFAPHKVSSNSQTCNGPSLLLQIRAVLHLHLQALVASLALSLIPDLSNKFLMVSRLMGLVVSPSRNLGLRNCCANRRASLIAVAQLGPFRVVTDESPSLIVTKAHSCRRTRMPAE